MTSCEAAPDGPSLEQLALLLKFPILRRVPAWVDVRQVDVPFLSRKKYAGIDVVDGGLLVWSHLPDESARTEVFVPTASSLAEISVSLDECFARMAPE